MHTWTNALLQDSIMDPRVKSKHCTDGTFAAKDERIELTINPYDYYNNRFFEGGNGQHSKNQNRPPVKKWKQNVNFLPRDTEVCKNSLQIGLSKSNLAGNSYTGKVFENGHKPKFIPLKVDGSMSIGPSENNRDGQWYRWLCGNIFKSDLTREGPLETKSKKAMSDYYFKKEKIDGEANVDLAANKHNCWNHTIHDYLWCPFVLFFVFFCCAPAVLLMHKSDIAFRKGRDSEARRCAMCSSLLYGMGLVFTLAFYSMIFALVIFFAQ
ncbi:hypothetical protein ACJMK2_006655 [Sinanodonta woodiana]|uniref:Uncharacterized protein n=1 Tax=Sinanodonta woodiana TaxID=1069815 RepID=A0ABD3VTU7_SINWO